LVLWVALFVIVYWSVNQFRGYYQDNY
jgi:hypothetical protein